MKMPVVIVIFSHKPSLQWHERVSLRQCHDILGQHPLRLMCPQGMMVDEYIDLAPNLEIDQIDPAHFSDLKAYNRLKTSRFLYDHYAGFEFLLTYELDAFVFRDELLDWCAAGWDYIGAPWFEGWYDAAPDAEVVSGGNSGFSLRRISAARRVLGIYKGGNSIVSVYSQWKEYGKMSPGSLFLLFNQITRLSQLHPEYRKCEAKEVNEDKFWSRHVRYRFNWFRVADYETSKFFSFETLPGRLLKETGGRLPFGCHKWQGRELSFWRPYIESFGHHLPE